MKKVLVMAILALVSATMVMAQPRAIGGRLGYGAEVSYQHQLSDNMVQLEVGIPGFNHLEAACTYDWIDPFNAPVPWEERGEWHWYMGVGGAVNGNFEFNTCFVGAAGRIGIEYDFWFPLQLSIDFRPTLGYRFGNESGLGYDLYGGGLGLGIRYKF